MVVLTCWTFEVQCLIQIVRNRISLLIHNEREKFWLKWGSFGLVLLINISVFCIWIPARLQISPFWIHLNNIWDRIEKGLFLIIDGGLNMYFIVLVKRKLLSSGMTKYKPLFHFNIVMVAISLSLDVALIALMSMKNGLIYAVSQTSHAPSRPQECYWPNIIRIKKTSGLKTQLTLAPAIPPCRLHDQAQH